MDRCVFGFTDVGRLADYLLHQLSKTISTIRNDSSPHFHLYEIILCDRDSSPRGHLKLYFLILLFFTIFYIRSPSFSSLMQSTCRTIFDIDQQYEQLIFKRVQYIDMAERKVLIKYFPKNFDHERIEKRGRGRDKLMMVRNMLPMSLRCSTCQNYLYMGTKFNMRMQICNEETYLGIKVFRFYFKCTVCYGEITFKTDPKNHDYLVELGATRNYQVFKDALQAEKYLKRLNINQKSQNSMQYLEHKSYDSKREMELMEALEDIKNLNKRQAVIDPEDLLKNLIYQQQQEDGFNEEEEAQIQKKYMELRQMTKKQEAEDEHKQRQMLIEQNPINEKKGVLAQNKVILSQQAIKEETKPAISNQLFSLKPLASVGEKKPVVFSVIANMKKKIIKPANKKVLKTTTQKF